MRVIKKVLAISLSVVMAVTVCNFKPATVQAATKVLDLTFRTNRVVDTTENVYAITRGTQASVVEGRSSGSTALQFGSSSSGSAGGFYWLDSSYNAIQNCTSGITINTWVKMSDVSKNQVLFNFGTLDTVDYNLYVGPQGVTSWMHWDDTNSKVTGGTLTANTWYQITLTQDTSGNTSLYVNGNQVASGNNGRTLKDLCNGYVNYLSSIDVPNAVGYSTLSSSAGDFISNFTGQMQEFSISNGVLSASEVVSSYNAGPSTNLGVTRVTCVGDSITEGIGASSSSTNYPSQLQSILGSGYTVTNAGSSGSQVLRNDVDYAYVKTTKYTLGLSSNPDVVIILLGTNDTFASNISSRTAEFKSDYEALVEEYQNCGTNPRIILAVPTYCYEGWRNGNNLNYTIPMIREVAAEKDLQLLETHVFTEDWTNETYLSDGLHPNDSGYTLLANYFAKAITSDTLNEDVFDNTYRETRIVDTTNHTYAINRGADTTTVQGTTKGSTALGFGKYSNGSSGGYYWKDSSYNAIAQCENGITINTWVKLKDASKNQVLFNFGTLDTVDYNLYVGPDGITSWMHWDNTNSKVGGGQLKAGLWYQLTLTQDVDGNTALYINGNKVASGNNGTTIKALCDGYVNNLSGIDVPNAVGYSTLSSSAQDYIANFTGAMQEFKIINGVARASQVAAMYEAGPSTDYGKTRITCVGDSITEGYMASSSSTTYPARLQNLLGSDYQVTNAGVSAKVVIRSVDNAYSKTSGYTTGLTSYPDAVVIMLGTNDARDISDIASRLDEFKSDYEALINEYKACGSNPKIFVAVPCACLDSVRESNNINYTIPKIKEVANEYGLQVLDTYNYTYGWTNDNYLSDGLHPNDAGYLKLAEFFKDAITDYFSESSSERNNEVVAGDGRGIEFDGYQISTTAQGSRVVYGVESEINGVDVESSGIIYGLANANGEDLGLTDDKMILNSTDKWVFSYESTSKGYTSAKLGSSNNASYYVQTLKFGKQVPSAYQATYRVRAYAVLCDGSVIYSDVYSYTTYKIADFLYKNSKMDTAEKHQYLYENILSVVNPDYEQIEYGWSAITR